MFGSLLLYSHVLANSAQEERRLPEAALCQ